MRSSRSDSTACLSSSRLLSARVSKLPLRPRVRNSNARDGIALEKPLISSQNLSDLVALDVSTLGDCAACA
eukprot:400970-Rhodomonas_salina.3